MFRRLPVAAKLTLALLPLVVSVLALGGIFAYQTYESVEGERISARAAGALVAVDRALAAIDAELAQSVEVTAGKVLDLSEVRTGTDAAVADLQSAVQGIPVVQREDLGRVGERIAEARAEIDAGESSGARAVGHFERSQATVLGLADTLPQQASDAELFRALFGLRSVIDARHEMAEQQLLILDTVSGRNQISASPEAARIRIDRLSESIDESVDSFLESFDVSWAERYEAIRADAAMDGTDERIGSLVEGGVEAPEVESVGIIDWISRLDRRQDRISELAGDVANAAIGQAGAKADQAQQRVVIIVAGVGLIVFVSILITSLVARSVARRVRQVAARARHVSESQIPTLMDALENPKDELELPQPSPIRDASKDELGELSRSFNTMQVTIDDVARRQIVALRKGVSEIFVSLARRNRALIDRQLAVIDELERDETDPETLADLYRLDHLATRMRRNAENLLVLAGAETPRRWRQPVGLDDCIRAAVSEVEEYRRVDVLNLEPIAVKGGVVTDLSHLLAELIDNATSFSPPQTRVRVAGYFDADGYLVTVADSGVGLGPVKLAELNELLEQPPVIGLALEPTLGLYVVARLAARHEIDVRLVKGAPGVTAQVRIPSSLYESVSATPHLTSPFGADDDRIDESSTAIDEDVAPATQIFASSLTATDDSGPEIRPVPVSNGRSGAIVSRLRQVGEDRPFRSSPASSAAPNGTHVSDQRSTGDPSSAERLGGETPERPTPPREVQEPPMPEHQTIGGLPVRRKSDAGPAIEDQDGASRSGRSANGLRTAFSQFQQGSQIARRSPTEDEK